MSLAKRVVLSYSTRLLIQKQYGKFISCSSDNTNIVISKVNDKNKLEIDESTNLNQWKPIEHKK